MIVIVEQGEQCDGTTTCEFQGVGGFGCSTSCQCCDGGSCPIVGCCDPRDLCVPLSGPMGAYYGSCVAPITCSTDADCSDGYVCLPNPTPPPATGLCQGTVGAGCPTIFIPDLGTTYTYPCAPPAVCTASICCLPTGTSCTADAACCGGSCAGGTCS